jgi:hypothetical protein
MNGCLATVHRSCYLVVPMKSLKFILHIGLDQPGLLAANTGAAFVWKAATLVIGLVTRNVLDTLSDNAGLGVSVWTLVALLLALGIVEFVGVAGEALMFH